jgi:hypothetical protein
MPIRFSRCGPGSPGKKKRGLASPGPFVGFLFSRGRSN